MVAGRGESCRAAWQSARGRPRGDSPDGARCSSRGNEGGWGSRSWARCYDLAHGCRQRTRVQPQKMSSDALCPHCDRMTHFLFCLPGETAEKKAGRCRLSGWNATGRPGESTPTLNAEKFNFSSTYQATVASLRSVHIAHQCAVESLRYRCHPAV
jgi:hypothetical protein